MQCIIDGSAIYYDSFGKGIPLLCLHGFSEDHRVMVGCVEPIMEANGGYRRIYPDLPGMGKSKPHPAVRCADDMLEVLIRFINMTIGDQPFLLMGQSYGGYLALGLIHRIGARITGAFLLSPCTVARRCDRHLPEREIVLREAITLSSQEDEAIFADFCEDAAVVTVETWTRYQREILPGLRAADEAFVKAYQGGAGYGFSFEDEMRRSLCFTNPASFVTGAMDDCVGYADAYALLVNFPRASFLIVDGAGHNVQIEYPQHFAFAFEDFLIRVRRTQCN